MTVKIAVIILGVLFVYKLLELIIENGDGKPKGPSTQV